MIDYEMINTNNYTNLFLLHGFADVAIYFQLNKIIAFIE